MAVIQSSDQDFKQLLADNSNVVVKYYADWCGSCRLFAPKFVRMSNEEGYADIAFLDVNAEKSPEARKMAGVNNLPFFAVFKNGELVAGDFTAKEEGVRQMIDSNLLS